MNLKLNAIQKREICTKVESNGMDMNAFEFSTTSSEIIFQYVRHAYDCLSGDEATEAEVLVFRANPQYFFTFERNSRGRFLATTNPEFDVGRSIETRSWNDLVGSFSHWLQMLAVEIQDLGLKPAPPCTLQSLMLDKDLAGVKRSLKEPRTFVKPMHQLL